MKFNINYYVKVKLTKHGKELLRLDHDAFIEQIKAFSPPLAEGRVFKLPKEDEEGWSKWQMWHLFETFGKHMYLGCNTPFETEIEIVENE